MTIYLNTDKPLENYKKLVNTEYFVDKSKIIESITKRINTVDGYICVTRPRRFGKSSVADMLGAYYSKVVNSKEIFDKLNISKWNGYEEHLNKYNVISISFNKIPDREKNYKEYINMIREALIDDIKALYPNLEIKNYFTISDVLYSTKEKFVFIFDEWDYIFNNNLFIENQNDFLEFLRNILKDQSYVLLCYMTGVLPIKKYSSGSALNMFDEHTMLSDMIYGDYFGFTEEEVKKLCEKSDEISFDEVSEWYNGYLNENGRRLYNPRSVVKALQNKKCKSYWTNTGAMEEVVEILRYNTLEIRDDVIEMVAGEEIDITIDEEFRAGQGTPKTKEEIYSAMIVLGFLSYYDGYLKIPNKELMKEFEKALKDESFPRRKKDKAFIVELKKDEKPEVALNQIRNKEYIEKFKKENEDKNILAVAICYDSKEKEHRCLIEEL